ncbi:MAG: hypothetical protein UY23_C0004G0016 [Candidatus Jorgensenbacteria bacterium GW2011_GWA1_48_11]|uniref:DUF218 domain-containing protein n=1 Tax=Candidatus Jorgensenbacteria bacterium GW2011_GWA1_48_11 TaxID=1618660 RepID=A0A0G1UA60_9BACT|nr:MAG: hypothetical protein UY23_C0004G0016 [Candidatus Jorgensenbacteria bacterium GW2011_GWA1_48_11]KKW11803.1 MAG: hypothetical protein UY51_C0005G0044 [Candidatus Jorgensenbacteria bacterium GW2011_GWB1_49_9]
MNSFSVNSNIEKVLKFLVQAEPDEEIPRCDAIFVFGTTNGEIAKQAVHLYQKNKASRIIISGWHRHDGKEGPFSFHSEAEYLASVAEKDGVSKENIVIEKRATNTYENVIFGMRACKEVGFSPKTLILVAVPYLLRRARACFVKNFPEIKIYGSAMPVTEEFFTPYRISRIKGELPRLVKYAEAGMIAPTVISEEIKKSATLF